MCLNVNCFLNEIINDKLYVFGHTKPDTDSIASAIVFAKLQKALGIDAVAYKLGEVNKETNML